MAYTTVNKSRDYFNTVTFTGTGSSNAVTGVGFRPDWLWIKNRSTTASHILQDVVRSPTKQVYSDLTNAEVTGSDGVSSFDSDGFTVGTGASFNGNGNGIVSWNWLASGSQGSSNTDGSINTTYTSANTTSGFSISSYTGTGSNATIGHGLGAVPKFMIIKNLTDSADWIVYHHKLGGSNVFHLNTTDNEQAAAGVFNSSDPTSSLINLGTDSKSNGSGKNYICYAFAEKTGFSHFNVYRGNNSTDGSFVYTGFKPAWILMKRNASGASWSLVDTKRPGYNETNLYLLPDTTAADQSTAVDILSNGFKLKTSAGNQNAASSYYYAAFAEAPLVGSNNVPCTAR